MSDKPLDTLTEGAPTEPDRGLPEGSTLEAPASNTSGPGAERLRLPSGTVLADRYRIVTVLGKGGMGEVYRADDLKLDVPVALKFLPAEVETDPGRLAQLFDEVKVARKINHPNVCRVYDLGEADGVHFLSMEYIDGEDLKSLLRRIGRLPWAKAVELGRQICDGLGAAHEAGILHRDLKPANLMIDGEGRARRSGSSEPPGPHPRSGSLEPPGPQPRSGSSEPPPDARWAAPSRAAVPRREMR